MEHLAANDKRNFEVPKDFSLIKPLEDPKLGSVSGSSGYPSVVYKVCSEKG